MPTDPSAIEQLAYRLWMEQGRPHGSHEAHWREAEARLRTPKSPVDEASEESFPASDAPASHLPDIPPANAAAKWATANAAKAALKPK